ncbi:MAG: hypothetical protein J0H98_03840 [Solirubrobacterales bacterium]|nr:hypothetical protein [Solirubrobacterales bacterium]
MESRRPNRSEPVEAPIACLGEAITDLICERNLAAGEAPSEFVPHPGGALANVAVAVARAGHRSALIGGVGDDGWGRWLRDGLAREGVHTGWVASLPGVDTPLALVEFGPDNEPAFQVYGEHIGPTMAATAPFLEVAIEDSQALVIGSNTMVGEPERRITRRAVELARAAGRPVLLDPNYRPNRWEEATAREYCRELAAASDIVKANRAEARLITGIDDPIEAARELARMGPSLVVVTAGEGEILTAGAVEARHSPEPRVPVSPLGAGDAFMGALAAALSGLAWDLARAAEALPVAAEAAAGACAGWGAQ